MQKQRFESSSQARLVGNAVRSLIRAGRGMQSAMARQLAMGDTDLAAMDELVTSPTPLGPVELGRRLGIRSASATVLVDRLEAVGHLHRHPHPSDRRRVVLEASESAVAEVRGTLTPMLMSMGQIAERLDPHDAEVVLAFLREVTTAMNDFAVTTDSNTASRRTN
ncbi:MAG: MarR family transcriptional regulator [Nakamurella sp.]